MTGVDERPADQRWRVVVIDDSPDDRAEIRRLLLLGSQRRYDFVEAETGAAGVRAVLEAPAGPPHCVILDYHLPDLEAPEVLAALPGSDAGRACPVVVVTGGDGQELGRAVLRAGAQDYISKAWMTAESLTRAVENAVERWAMARELRTAETRFRVLAGAVPQAVCMVDATGRAVYVNDRWREYFGALAERIEHGEWLTVFPIDEAAETLQRLRELSARGTAYQYECLLRRHDGVYRWHQINAVPLRDSLGALTQWYAVYTDIHEVKESDARLRLTLEASRTGIWAWDLKTDAVTWSPECHEVHGVAVGQFAGTVGAFVSLIHPEDRARAEATVRAAIADHSLYQLDFRVVRPDGEVVWVQNLGRVSLDVSGEPVRMLGTSTDISRRKRTEAALEQAVRTRDQLVSLVSHDLKNPLHVLMMAIQLLDTKVLAEGRELLRRMARQVQRMNKMIDELLDVAQLHAGKPLVLDLRSTDLVPLVRGLVEEHSHAAPRHRIDVSRAAEAIVGRWDPKRLARVVDNLLSNAIKYSPGGGAVRVDLDRTSDEGAAWAVLRVTDEGIGIAEDERDSVFQWYSRGANARRLMIEGTGIGLAGAQDIVEQHGGSISVESEEGKGSVFTVRLPISTPTSTSTPTPTPVPDEAAV